MNTIAFLIKVLPLIVQLVKLAEKLFSDKPGSGQEKKALVLEVLSTMMSGADSVLTGGAAGTWANLKDPISSIIDGIVAITFPKD